MAALNWLHLTDLHQGLAGQKWLWPAVKDAFFDDLAVLHDKSGPWDLVLFTGDLTQRGSAGEFQRLGDTLDRLWAHLKSLGSEPALIAVPGNHDLVRPGVQGRPLPSALRALRRWHDDESLRRDFWDTPDNEYRALVREAFAAYEVFCVGCAMPPHFSVKRGLLPGDVSVSFTKGGLSTAVVGLNTAFLQLTDGDYLGHLELDPRQFHAVTDSDDPTGWVRRHDVALLLTHHPTEWLHTNARGHLVEDVAPAGQFFAHLHGHMHESTSATGSVAGSAVRRAVQGPSLFGLETLGDGTTQRIHGYMAARVEIIEREGRFTLWPRVSTKTRAGVRQMAPDYGGFTLGIDGSLVERFEARRSLKPPPVDPLHATSPSKSPSIDPVPEPDPIPLPGSGYDASWYVSRPEVEAQLRACLTFPRSPAVVRSCRGMGRTWVLEHATRDLRVDGTARVIDVQFSLLADTGEESFLRSLADQIAEGCGLSDSVDEAWARGSLLPVRMQRLMRQWLEASTQRLVLVLNVPDDRLSHPAWSSFAAVLRAWNEAGARAPWDRLRLLMAWSTMPSAWGTEAGSPFRVPEIPLEDLDDNAMCDLAGRHGLTWGAAELARIRSLVGGHPSLLRRLLFAQYQGVDLDVIERGWRVNGGVFWEPNLRELVGFLRKHPELCEAFVQVAREAGTPVRGEVLERLVAAGLLVRDEKGPRLRYRVYEVLPRLL